MEKIKINVQSIGATCNALPYAPPIPSSVLALAPTRNGHLILFHVRRTAETIQMENPTLDLMAPGTKIYHSRICSVWKGEKRVHERLNFLEKYTNTSWAPLGYPFVCGKWIANSALQH